MHWKQVQCTTYVERNEEKSTNCHWLCNRVVSTQIILFWWEYRPSHKYVSRVIYELHGRYLKCTGFSIKWRCIVYTKLHRCAVLCAFQCLSRVKRERERERHKTLNAIEIRWGSWAEEDSKFETWFSNGRNKILSHWLVCGYSCLCGLSSPIQTSRSLSHLCFLSHPPHVLFERIALLNLLYFPYLGPLPSSFRLS